MSSSLVTRCLKAAAAVAAAIGLPSCLDIEQHLVINPDGSGKVTMTASLAMGGLEGLAAGLAGGAGDSEPGKQLKPREQAREFAISMLRAQGIEAWSDVTYGVGKDGKTRASVTGYFPDVTKVKLSKAMEGPAAQDGLDITKTAEGNWLLETSMAGDGDDAAEAGTAEPAVPLSDEEVQDKLDQERQQWAGMKIFMTAFLENLRIAVIVQGGGTILDANVFEKKDERTAVFEFTGKKFIAGVDAILQDDDKAKALIRKGVSPTSSGGGESDSSDLFESMFGGDGKMRVTLKPGEPAFDYAAAVAKAKADESPELRALLEEAKKPAGKSDIPGSDDGEAKDDDAAASGEPDSPSPSPSPSRFD